MCTKLVVLALGLGVMMATAAPALACAFHDQAASQSDMKTAQADQGSKTSAQ